MIKRLSIVVCAAILMATVQAEATLFGVDLATDQLITIDPATGAGTPVGPLGFGSVSGLAFDPTTGTLFGVDDDTRQLIAIDPATGAGTAVGSLGFSRIVGLAYDPTTGTLFGANLGSVSFLATIDPATGARTPVGPLGFGSVSGLAFDSPAPNPVPEPGTMLLMGSGLAGMLGYGWRKRKQQNI